MKMKMVILFSVGLVFFTSNVMADSTEVLNNEIVVTRDNNGNIKSVKGTGKCTSEMPLKEIPVNFYEIKEVKDWCERQNKDCTITPMSGGDILWIHASPGGCYIILGGKLICICCQ